MIIRIEPAYSAGYIAMLFTLFVFASAAFTYIGINAVDKEMAFNENIRMSRCAHQYLPGYCGDLKIAQRQEAGE